jgi:vancomycin aglycone glucosyltransferase
MGRGGDVEPMAGLAVRLRALGAEVRVCVPQNFAELLARVGMQLVPVGQPVRPMVTGATPPSAAEGCDALAPDGMMLAGVWL